MKLKAQSWRVILKKETIHHLICVCFNKIEFYLGGSGLAEFL